MSEFTGAFKDGVEVQQTVSLADAFLHELVRELDHEGIVGITLGGSYARGTATRYSDVDVGCFCKSQDSAGEIGTSIWVEQRTVSRERPAELYYFFPQNLGIYTFQRGSACKLQDWMS